LLANNTIGDCQGAGFRLFENNTPKKHVVGQVEFLNNLLFNCSVIDAAYVVNRGENASEAGDPQELVKAWKFRGNARDLSGSRIVLQIPQTDADRRLAEADLVSTDTQTLERIRPVPGSPLATFGSGSDPALPAYVGAMPPEGVAPWDWERTWRLWMKPKEK
jgi:hypothetical protein